MNDSLTSKIFATNWDAWNNKWRAFVTTPFLAMLGVLIGSVLNIHFASSELGQTLLMGLFVGITMIAGYTLLALID